MLGIIGAKTIHANGVWWESDDIVGKVYDSHLGKKWSYTLAAKSVEITKRFKSSTGFLWLPNTICLEGRPFFSRVAFL